MLPPLEIKNKRVLCHFPKHLSGLQFSEIVISNFQKIRVRPLIFLEIGIWNLEIQKPQTAYSFRDCGIKGHKDELC